MSGEEVPILYYFGQSFYSQKVLLYFHEKDVKFKRYVVDFANFENYKPYYMKMSPTGQIPLLKDNGTIVPDSNQIISYIENKYGSRAGSTTPMLPSGGQPQEQCRELWALLDSLAIPIISYGGMIFPHHTTNCRMPSFVRKMAANMTKSAKRSKTFQTLKEKYPEHREVYQAKQTEWLQNERDFCDEQRLLVELKKTESVLDQVEKQLQSMHIEFSGTDHWLVGRDFCVADVVLAVTLNRLDLIGFSHRFWGEGASRPRIAEYFSRLQDRKAFQDVCKLSFWKSGLPMVMKMLSNVLPWKSVFIVGSLAVLVGFAFKVYQK